MALAYKGLFGSVYISDPEALFTTTATPMLMDIETELLETCQTLVALIEDNDPDSIEWSLKADNFLETAKEVIKKAEAIRRGDIQG